MSHAKIDKPCFFVPGDNLDGKSDGGFGFFEKGWWRFWLLAANLFLLRERHGVENLVNARQNVSDNPERVPGNPHPVACRRSSPAASRTISRKLSSG